MGNANTSTPITFTKDQLYEKLTSSGGTVYCVCDISNSEHASMDKKSLTNSTITIVCKTENTVKNYYLLLVPDQIVFQMVYLLRNNKSINSAEMRNVDWSRVEGFREMSPSNAAEWIPVNGAWMYDKMEEIFSNNVEAVCYALGQ